MAAPHRAAIKYTITPENYEGWITIRSALDGTVQNTGVARYRQLNSKHLRPVSIGNFDRNGIFLSVKTSQSKISICQAAKTCIFKGNKELKPRGEIIKKGKAAIFQDFKIFVHKRDRYVIEKIVSIYTSKNMGVQNPLARAVSSVKKSHRFDKLLKSHIRVWDALWKRFDIEIQGGVFSQKVLRLHTFHLLQTASFHNRMIDAGLPARGLHGEAYRGHIFWDELYVMPFFNLHIPETAKALLLYRYRRLAKAREYARKDGGYKGAMFPWQSGSTGEEETQIVHLNPISGKWGPDYSRIQRHNSFAIAYNVWQYWKVTGDLSFLSHYGAEIILSIAQFGASLTKYNSRSKKYHTDGIMGSDEFHERLPGSSKPGFKDNAYTNLLIVWTLLRAQEILDILPERHKIRLLSKLKLNQKELNKWQDITRKMNIIINKNGIISQFDGYFKLKDLNWKAYRIKYGKIGRLDRILKAEGKSSNAYKAAKQADALMIFYLLPLSEIKDLFHRLGYKFNKHILKKNYDYYVHRTSHGSTLSEVVHCYIAHLIGRRRDAWQWFLNVLKSDIYDTQGGTTPEGIHAGVMGASINITLKAFAGIEIFDDRIGIKPDLPKSWKSIKLKVFYKGDWISLFITKRQVTIFIKGPKSKKCMIPFEIYGKPYSFVFGKTYKINSK